MEPTSEQVEETARGFVIGVQQDLEAHGRVDRKRIDPLRRSKNFAISVFDAAAVILARRYRRGEIDYETADWISNSIGIEMLDLMIELQPNRSHIDTPQDWAEVYEAFDAGEHDHFGRSKDPVSDFTNPQIDAFLEKFERRE